MTPLARDASRHVSAAEALARAGLCSRDASPVLAALAVAQDALASALGRLAKGGAVG